MNIYLHVGSHKTGTTSIQKWLLKSNLDNKVLYPDPSSYGPGHAILAWKTLGLHAYKIDNSPLLKEIKKASLNRKDIIISSEEFSRGLVNNNIEIIREVKNYGKLNTIQELADSGKIKLYK